MYVQHNQTVYYLTRQQNPTNVNAENPVIINGYNDDFKLISGKAYVPQQLFIEILKECFEEGNSTIEAHIEVVSIINTLCNHFIPPVDYIAIDESDNIGDEDCTTFALLKRHSKHNEINTNKLVAEYLVNEPYFPCMAGNTTMVRWICENSDVSADEVARCIEVCLVNQNYNCLFALKNASNWDEGLDRFFDDLDKESLSMLERGVLLY